MKDKLVVGLPYDEPISWHEGLPDTMITIDTVTIRTIPPGGLAYVLQKEYERWVWQRVWPKSVSLTIRAYLSLREEGDRYLSGDRIFFGIPFTVSADETLTHWRFNFDTRDIRRILKLRKYEKIDSEGFFRDWQSNDEVSK